MTVAELITVLWTQQLNKQVLVGYEGLATEPIEDITLRTINNAGVWSEPRPEDVVVIWAWPGVDGRDVRIWTKP